MEYLKRCPLCVSPSEKFILCYRRKNSNVVKCKTCDLLFVNPRDYPARILQQYFHNETSKVQYYLATAKADEIVFKQNLKIIEQQTLDRRLLDVGCNVGTFMDVARRRGWQVMGIEPNKKACEVCQGKNLPVIEGLFSDELAERLKMERFNLICMNDAIEHFPDPLASLTLEADLLPPGGLVSVTTPNIASLLSKIFQIKPEEHLFYFNRETLSRLLTKAGFSVLFLIERGRKRDVGSMHLGASLPPFWISFSKFLALTKLSFPVSFLLERIFKDELFVLARKRG